MALVAVLVAGGVAGSVAAEGGPSVVATAGGHRLVRRSSGLLIKRSFATPVPDRIVANTFEFNGDASPTYSYVRDPGGGLRVGMGPHGGRTFKGYFAVTLAAYPASSIFHVHMTRPPGNVTGTGHEAETVFAVQTGSTKVTGLINFVEISSDSRAGTTAWQVGYSHGHVKNAQTRLFARSAQSAHAPLSQDITVATDGHHHLTVWFGNRVVFHSDHLDMNMQAPFQPYLEVQSEKVPYVSTFTDFWVTHDTSLTVDGLAPGSSVSLMAAATAPGTGATAAAAAPGTGGTGAAAGPPGAATPASRPIATALASASGQAVLWMPPPRAQGVASLVITSPGGSSLRMGPFNYAGGDQYQLQATK
ncbi:MAG: hypothetical protein ACRD0I_04985 [Acidimicrobiales bacterium]